MFMKRNKIMKLATMLALIYVSTVYVPLPVKAEYVPTDYCVVQGTLRDWDTGETLPGVAIQVKGTSRGTVTDANGHYWMIVPCDSSIVFWFLGFISFETDVNYRSIIDVDLRYCEC